MGKLYLFGIGTGRCGTVSLSKLLNSQTGAQISHEKKPFLPWIPDNDLILLKVARLVISEANIVGDVSLFNLQSAETILKLLPSAKFVALKRDKKETIESYRIRWEPKRNKIRDKRGGWDKVFPHYQLPLVESLAKYYDEYYEKVQELEERYPLNVKCFSTNNLNSRAGVTAILNFCTIPEENRAYLIGIRKNQRRRGRANPTRQSS